MSLSHPPGKGKLVVISGPSGTGKTTVCRKLLELDPNYKLSISATTRPPRKNEKDNRDYCFVSREEFEKKIEAGKLAEYAEYAGNLYGTPRAPLDEWTAAGRTVLMDIDVQGAEQVLKMYPHTLTIFLEPPDFNELLRRLDNRATDAPEGKRKRLKIARGEMARRPEFRHTIINDDLEETVRKIHSIIAGENNR